MQTNEDLYDMIREQQKMLDKIIKILEEINDEKF
jgi:hypothetical protein